MKKYILPGAAAVFLGVIIYQTYTIETTKNKLQDVSNQLVELKSTNEALHQSISGIDSSIQYTLNEELGKSHLTKDVEFKLNKNVESGYDLNVRVELKELKEDKKVLFMYKEKELDTWEQIELKEVGELSYSGDFILQYEKSYEYKVILKGITTESGDVEFIEKTDFIPEFPECHWDYNEVGMYFDAYSLNYGGQENDNQIKTLEVIISSNKKEMIYSAKKTEEPIYEGDEIIDYDERYGLQIDNKDYIENIDYVKVKITYENGIINVEDITDKKW